MVEFLQLLSFSALVVVQVVVSVVYKLSQTNGGYSYSPSSALTIAELIKLSLSLGLIIYSAYRKKTSSGYFRLNQLNEESSNINKTENGKSSPINSDPDVNDSSVAELLSEPVPQKANFVSPILRSRQSDEPVESLGIMGTAYHNIVKELTPSFILSIFGLALLYCINNQLAFVLFLYVDPASITLFKSWATALSALILWQWFNRPIGKSQWAAISLQVVGLIIVQYDPCINSASSSLSSYLLLMLSVSITAICGVWNEQIVKNQNASLNVQNAALYTFGSLMNFSVYYFAPINYPASGIDAVTGTKVAFFAGYTLAAIGVILCNSVLGLIITAVYKYADAIVKTFATATATAALLFINTALFNIRASLIMYLGTFVVFIATYIYFNGGDLISAANSSWTKSSLITNNHQQQRSGNNSSHTGNLNGEIVLSEKSNARESRTRLLCLAISLAGALSLALLAFNNSDIYSNGVPLNIRRLSVNTNGFFSLNAEQKTSRPRVAHCFAGSARTMWMSEVYALYKANVIDKIFDADHDLFLVTDAFQSRSHGKSLEYWPRSWYQEAVTQFNFTREIWLDEPHNYTHLTGASCGYDNFRICQTLIEEQEKKFNFRYHHVIRSRPDLLILTPLASLAELPPHEIGMPPYYEGVGNLPKSQVPWNQSKYWRDNAWGDPKRNAGGANDLFAVMPRDLAPAYLNTANILAHNPDLSLYCGQWGGVCECKPKASMEIMKVNYQPWALDVKIRRSYAFCVQGQANGFNQIC